LAVAKCTRRVSNAYNECSGPPQVCDDGDGDVRFHLLRTYRRRLVIIIIIIMIIIYSLYYMI